MRTPTDDDDVVLIISLLLWLLLLLLLSHCAYCATWQWFTRNAMTQNLISEFENVVQFGWQMCWLQQQQHQQQTVKWKLQQYKWMQAAGTWQQLQLPEMSHAATQQMRLWPTPPCHPSQYIVAAVWSGVRCYCCWLLLHRCGMPCQLYQAYVRASVNACHKRKRHSYTHTHT